MNSSTKLCYLENLHVVHTLSGPEKQHLHEQTRMQTFARGETIYIADDPADSLYVLKAGQVKISHRPASGQEVILALYGPGNLFGELTRADAPALAACGEEAVSLRQALVCQLAAADF